MNARKAHAGLLRKTRVILANSGTALKPVSKAFDLTAEENVRPERHELTAIRKAGALKVIAEGALPAHLLPRLTPSRRGSRGRTATQGSIRVAIVHEQRLVSEAFRASLSRKDGIEIVGVAGHGLQPIDRLQELKPDVVLLDIGPNEMDGVESIRAITQQCPGAKLLVLTAPRDEAVIIPALRAGAKGYVSTNASAADLRKAIRVVHQGDVWVERKLIVQLLKGDAYAEVSGEIPLGPAREVLTAREQAVLRRLASGGTNKDIAQSLFISEKTVKTHLSSIFRKLNVTRRLQAVIYAIRQGLTRVELGSTPLNGTCGSGHP
jgi:DNA-binding NarL/FixJ family response regulator